MKLTTRARYGTRALLELALAQGSSVQLKVVAARQDISKKYLEQLLAPLKDAGIIHTVRGPNGGYRLARDPEDIGLAEVLRVLEGPLELVDCVNKGEICPRAEACATRELWTSVAGVIGEALDRFTLANLVQHHRRLLARQASKKMREEGRLDSTNAL